MFLCGRYSLSLNRPLVMGIVNVTPDSFSDGGQHNSAERAISHAMQLVEDGADILDIGGESTRPGAHSVGIKEELARILPVIEGLQHCGRPLSVDTLKPEVMRAAIQLGADMINDVNALQSPSALKVLAESGAGVCLMHMQGEPRTMQHQPRYQNVLEEVKHFLAARVAAAELAGISRDRIVVDPGFGFGKALEHNLALLQGLDACCELGVPVLAGLSRKSMLGELTGLCVGERMVPSVVAAVISAMKGAKILRVHDVKETKQAFQVFNAVEETR